MTKVIEVSDFEMRRTKELMVTDGWEDPTDDEVFHMALRIRRRMEDCCMSARQAYMDLMY